MKISTLVLALIAIPASHAMADSSLPPYAVAAISELKIKVVVFLGCMLVGTVLGAVLARRIGKKNRMLRDLTFSLSVLAGSGVGMLIFLGKMPW
ncbi:MULTISPECIES: hypothetical protein [Pseudomonas]|jgi:hypothetical protein|uniref:hypothetical protein n=1 Tax=Pseudomonas TaxID=286 RepID=UPI00064BB496|nr:MULTISPECIES: hypothetical protein [Pseudomonas]HDS0958729.1 hypothetical protein [Pseudomonas putida]MBH8610599.1 hypothetical protein [Pseudomonas mohnii]MBJ2220936.1 hypothetical protein [Pseudomonas sp. MF7453]MCT9824080.1 hypothetical protein [Pseudomonas veronii]MDY7536535.1 hypothetical protein [Pseudomonas sp. Bout1]